MKIGLGVATAALAAGGTVWAVRGRAADRPVAPPAAAAPAPAPEAPAKVPSVVMDSTAGDWVMEPFLGAPSGGRYRFIDGPATHAGAAAGYLDAMAVAEDGTFFVHNDSGLVEVTPDGTARLLFEKNGLIEGPAEKCASGDPVWNPKEKTLYMTGPNCLRRVVAKPDGTRFVEVAAGVPGTAGKADGPARTATFNKVAAKRVKSQGLPTGMFVTSQGTVYISDNGIRKIENGAVTTVTAKIGGFYDFNEAEGIFYVDRPDTIRGCASFDPKTGEIRNLVGAPKSCGHYEGNCDGPALTDVSFNSNFDHCVWDPVHKALWVGGPDENRLRWLKDGWVKTMWPRQNDWHHEHVFLVDSQGRAYAFSHHARNCLFRFRNAKETKQ